MEKGGGDEIWDIDVKNAMDMLRALTQPRRVLYRVVVDLDTGALILEACHFEVFLPDRPDLRFISPRHFSRSFSFGQLVFVSMREIQLSSTAEFMRCGNMEYPVAWELKSDTYEILPTVLPGDRKRRKVCYRNVGSDVHGVYTKDHPKKGSMLAIVDGFSFPVYLDSNRVPKGAKGELYAMVTTCESAWIAPCEPVRDLDAYTRVTRLVHSSMAYHGVAIDHDSLEVKEVEKFDKNLGFNDAKVFEEKRAFDLKIEETLEFEEENETYWEYNAILRKEDPPVIEMACKLFHPYLILSFPHWVTDTKFPLFAVKRGKDGDKRTYMMDKCPALENLWDDESLAPCVDVRIHPCFYPELILSSFMANREDYLENQIYTDLPGQWGLNDDMVPLFGAEASLDLDSLLSTIDDTFAEPRNVRDSITNNNNNNNNSKKNDDYEILNAKIRNQAAVRLALVQPAPPLIILGEQGAGKTSAVAAIALGKPKGTKKLLLAKTRDECRDILSALGQLDRSCQVPRRFATAILENEDECCDFFVAVRDDIVIATAHTVLMRMYHRDYCFQRPLSAHYVIVDNAHDFTDDMLYMILKIISYTQLILIGDHKRAIAPGKVATLEDHTCVLQRALFKENMYVTRIARNPLLLSTTKEFFFPVSKYCASGSLSRYCKEMELPALQKVLAMLVDAKLNIDDTLLVMTTKAHAQKMSEEVPGDRSNDDNLSRLKIRPSYPEEAEGTVSNFILVFGGRKSDKHWKDKKLRHCLFSLHLDRLIFIGHSNPFDFPILTKASQLELMGF